MAHAIIFYDLATRPGTLRPLGAYSIASALRAQGLDVLVVPHCTQLSYAGVRQIIKNNSENLLWVGISTTFLKMSTHSRESIKKYKKEWATTEHHYIDFDRRARHDTTGVNNEILLWNYGELNSIADWLDKKFGCPFVVGGPNIPADSMRLHKNIHTVTGYAEKYALELTENLLNKNSNPIPFISNNTTYDNVGFKTSSTIWDKCDLVNPNEWLPLEVSRGCAFDCAYCSYTRKSTFNSYKDPESLRQEIIRNYETWGTTKYILVDDLYNDSKEKVRILYDKVWSKLPFQVEWVSYMRLDMFWSDPESIDIVKASGARAGGFGIETLHDVAGRKVGKGLGKVRILETLENLKNKWGDDIIVQAYWLAGLPFEPWENILETWEWSRTTDLLHFSIWNALMVAPPTNDASIIVEEASRLDKAPDAFKITWDDKFSNWTNSEGVTFRQCLDLILSPPRYPFDKQFSFISYPSMRYFGWSHQDIVNIKNGKATWDDVQALEHNHKKLATERLSKILQIT